MKRSGERNKRKKNLDLLCCLPCLSVMGQKIKNNKSVANQAQQVNRGQSSSFFFVFYYVDFNRQKLSSMLHHGPTVPDRMPI